MSHTPHELTEEFPDLADKIHALKTSDAHFAKLADEYHEIATVFKTSVHCSCLERTCSRCIEMIK